MSDISNLRETLTGITEEVLNLLHKRKAIVTDIQSHKLNDRSYYCFDPKQEFKIFTSIQKDLSLMSLKELLSFSIIIEAHACVEVGAYPLWSEQQHLKSNTPMTIDAMINPILLAVTHKELYHSLPISEEFKEKFGELFSGEKTSERSF